MTDSKRKYYSEHNGKGDKRSAPPYNIEVFEDIGRAFLIGILDFKNINPISRLPQSYYKNIEGVKADLISKGNIFMPNKSKPRQNTAKIERKKSSSKVESKQRTQSTAPKAKPKLKTQQNVKP